MNDVQAQTTKSYHSYLIESLKDPEEAAGYLEAIFEEENPEPELLQKVLSNILEALGETHLSSEQMEEHRQKLKKLLSQPGSLAIYQFSEWLNALGLKVGIRVQK